MIENSSSGVVFSVKKTHELNDIEITELNNLFNNIFKNNILKERNKDDFIARFSSNEKKYSFHGLMKKNEKIIGTYPVIPNKFKYFGKDLFFGLVVDTMIDKNYQGDLENLIKLNNLVYEILEKENICFIYGIANKKYYQIVKRLLKYEDITELNFHFKIVKIRKKNLTTICLSYTFVLINFIISIFDKIQDSKVDSKNIIQNKFENEDNFKKFNDVKIVENKNFKFAYKINSEMKLNMEMRNLYIFDIYPSTKRNISDAVNYCSKYIKDIDLIIYAENNKSKSLNLFNLPNFFLKNKPIISGKILKNSAVDNKIFDNSNWRLNLSNFDIK